MPKSNSNGCRLLKFSIYFVINLHIIISGKFTQSLGSFKEEKLLKNWLNSEKIGDSGNVDRHPVTQTQKAIDEKITANVIEFMQKTAEDIS